ncbi:hypothetical protein C8R45DRAFT_920938 [Mycena sanguinolenta]|nr:hypothetical protein C8R45DRAFT_920938 [Mycena sanguinolenta]
MSEQFPYTTYRLCLLSRGIDGLQDPEIAHLLIVVARVVGSRVLATGTGTGTSTHPSQTPPPATQSPSTTHQSSSTTHHSSSTNQSSPSANQSSTSPTSSV